VLKFVTSALFLARHIATRLLPKGTMFSRLGMYPKRALNVSHLDEYYSLVKLFANLFFTVATSCFHPLTLSVPAIPPQLNT
jgi:hypothetical protein